MVDDNRLMRINLNNWLTGCWVDDGIPVCVGRRPCPPRISGNMRRCIVRRQHVNAACRIRVGGRCDPLALEEGAQVAGGASSAVRRHCGWCLRMAPRHRCCDTIRIDDLDGVSMIIDDRLRLPSCALYAGRQTLGALRRLYIDCSIGSYYLPVGAFDLI